MDSRRKSEELNVTIISRQSSNLQIHTAARYRNLNARVTLNGVPYECGSVYLKKIKTPMKINIREHRTRILRPETTKSGLQSTFERSLVNQMYTFTVYENLSYLQKITYRYGTTMNNGSHRTFSLINSHPLYSST